ncbi:calcium homeostasis endoplasmic reticulum protein isoform X2 [Drosophila albomicans]|uniref:Calcium homeostasis endoplasmic reticulum protein isoform X2 n=1 Tax=Drosophila albomicans TaxID=7291 RepID=A0A9C6SRW5_DROAB|nr:calcium homeostasis endoplasmic reticulum protein isoform X2 [Drosophila albomicans]
MDVQPPRDASLRNIIDKLAEFVARNGPEFEAITKQKQQNNPKFEFLYGGEFANYYQYRVAAEQQMLKQQGAGMPSGPLYMQQPPPNHAHYAPQQQQQQQQQQPQQQSSDGAMQQSQHLWPPNANATNPSNPQVTAAAANGTALTLNLTTQLEAIKMQQNTLREQIKQSDANLSAQHTALMTQKTKQIDDAMATAQTTQLEQLANEQGIVLREFDSVLQPIIESCTKDSISAGKNWILQHSTDSAKINVVLQYLLKKALVNGSTFQQKLHLIYLVNDILHHCMRKNISDLKNNLENVVIPMFCSADLIASSDQRTKLSKLLSLWESKAKFFDACVISKLQSPDSSMQEYKTNVQNTHHDIVAKYSQSTKATLDNYQKQHQIFMQHATQQIAQLEQQKLQLEKQLLVAQKPPPQQQQQQQQQQQHADHLMRLNINAQIAAQLRDKKINVLFIEGFMIFNQPELLALCNIKYHVHLPYEKCFERRSKRTYDPPDVTGYFELCVWPYYEQNFAEYRDCKDITFLNGEISKEKIFKFVLQRIVHYFEERCDVPTAASPVACPPQQKRFGMLYNMASAGVASNNNHLATACPMEQ